MPKKTFTIGIEYFRPSGKLYVSETFQCQADALGDDQEVCYMDDVVDFVRIAQINENLPGLRSGKWDGPIRVDCEKGFPVLILPRT